MTKHNEHPAEARGMVEAWQSGRDIPVVEQRHKDAAAWAMDRVADSLTWDKATASHVTPERRWQMNRVAEAMARMERAALSATLSPQAGGGEARAWMRRWAFDREQGTKDNRPKHWKFLPVTDAKLFDEDVPLYASPPAPADNVGLVEAIHMLRDAAATFRDYERQHRAKIAPWQSIVEANASDDSVYAAQVAIGATLAKVERNCRMAKRCQEAADNALSALRANGAEREGQS